MRSVTSVLTVLAMVTIPALSLAGPPLNGDYTTLDMGGPVSTGRATESWDAGGGELLAGTTLSAASWNGATLGAEWRYTCGTLAAPAVLLVDNVNASGNGNRTYMKTFVGGQMWLSGSGPWANGDPSYSGAITSYTEFETIQYSSWTAVAAVSNVQAVAHFDNYPSTCVAFTTSNGVKLGTTDNGGAKPMDYPDFIAGGTCTATRTLGAWWNMREMIISIAGCEVPVQNSSWGSLKASYR